MRRNFSLIIGLLLPLSGFAAEFDVTVPMYDRGASTFYVAGSIGNLGDTEFMVDTGSSYLTINQSTLDKLVEHNLARYVRELKGRLADGSEIEVPVYSLSELRLGDACVLQNVEAAVFPGHSTRMILGLNVLHRAAPFIFSVDPPQLVLSHCGGDLASAS